MRVALLDVNVVIALFDPAHPNHDDAHDWFAGHERFGWATSTLTINGCIRVLSNPAYPSVRARPEEVVARLQQICGSPHHEFWTDSTTLLDPAVVRPELIGSHQKITDVCLLALACRNEGRLVTFDRTIPLKAVVGAKPEHLLVLGLRN